LVGKPEVKRQLGRPMLKGEYNINMDLLEIGRWHGMGLSGSGKGHANVVMNIRFAYNVENILSNRQPVGF